MNRLTLAFARALALAGAPTLALAQQVRTSVGVRMLPRIETLRTQAQLRQAQGSAERVLAEVLADANAADAARGGATRQVDTLSADVQRAIREFERANATFNEADQKYKTELAAFQQATVALEAEAQRQRAEGEAFAALPIEKRDAAGIARINDWAAQVNARRAQLDAERARLLAEQARVEGERAKLAKMRADNEARLRGQRDATVGALGSSGSKRIATYGELRIAVLYMRALREKLSGFSDRSLPHLADLDEAEAKLRAFEAEQRSSQ
jgi:hypothetical protein